MRFIDVRNKHELDLAAWATRSKKTNALNRGVGNLEAVSSGMHALVSSLFNGR